MRREHLYAKKGNAMNPNNLTWRPPTTKELFSGLTLFVIPMLPPLLKLLFGYQTLINQISNIITVNLLIIILVVLVLGLKHGFPRWTVPYLGIAVTGIVILEPSWRIFLKQMDSNHLWRNTNKTPGAQPAKFSARSVCSQLALRRKYVYS